MTNPHTPSGSPHSPTNPTLKATGVYNQWLRWGKRGSRKKKKNTKLLTTTVTGPDYYPVNMAVPKIHHNALQTTFIGTSSTTNEGTTVQSFRGIPYATVPGRFERAQPIEKFSRDTVDATKYGYVYFILLFPGSFVNKHTDLSRI